MIIKGVRNMEGWQIIQNCELAPLSGLYNKNQFLQEISQLTPADFNLFCRTYLHLSYFHASNQNAWLTDDTDIVFQHPGLFWKIDPIDFNSPVNFRRLK